MKPLLYVADSHLTRDDPEVDSFVRFLETAGRGAGTLYILGDLFNVWFGEPRFRLPHQARVLDALGRLAGAWITLDIGHIGLGRVFVSFLILVKLRQVLVD